MQAAGDRKPGLQRLGGSSVGCGIEDPGCRCGRPGETAGADLRLGLLDRGRKDLADRAKGKRALELSAARLQKLELVRRRCGVGGSDERALSAPGGPFDEHELASTADRAPERRLDLADLPGPLL
jgi:hypothetical protein